MPFDKPERLLSTSGANLALRIQLAKKQPAIGPAIGIVQICHGLAEHTARYQEFADHLSENGFHVYAHDHRGHGLTTSPEAPLGQFGIKDGAQKVFHDVQFVEKTIRERHTGLPVILFGHSMGGLITLAAICKNYCKPDAAAVCNANFSNPLTQKISIWLLKAERMFLGSDVPSSLMPKLTFHTWANQIENYQTQFDWLSHDTAEVALYNNDPLCGFAPSISMWLDIWRFMQACNDPALKKSIAFNLPLYLQGGGQDPSTEQGKSLNSLSKRLKHAGLSNITTQIYPAMRHESLHEIERQRFMQDFTSWAIHTIATK